MRKTPRVPSPPPDPARRDLVLDELVAVREIVHAFLTADRPEDVYQFTLDRIGPLVGASLASVYLIDGGSELMRLAAAYNWPERFRPWLGEMRVRVGFGPSGEAASERRVIEIRDLFGDADLEDWQEVATELGFRALVALPLQAGTRVLGTVTFYFAEAGPCRTDKKGLLRLVADTMAATAEKAALIESLRRTNAALQESNAELERQYIAALGGAGIAELHVGDFDPQEVLLEAIAIQTVPRGVTLRMENAVVPVLSMRSDRRKISQVLVSLLSNACKVTDRGEIVVGLSVDGDRVVWRVRDTGIGIGRDAHDAVFEEPRQLDGSPGSGLGLPLARRLARLLGGDVRLDSTLGEGSTFTVELPRELGST